jgi:DNA-binding transcriptional MocR family regulator
LDDGDGERFRHAGERTFVRAIDDREVAAAALKRGVHVQPLSINFRFDPPQYGLLLGFAAFGEREMRSAVESLRSAFKEFGRTV